MDQFQFVGAGIYSIPEASRLTDVSAARIRRWLKGYDFQGKKERRHSNPVWTGQLDPVDGKVAVGFRDLMEVRYVDRFLKAGVSWKTMRLAHEAAKVKLGSNHPFCTHQFGTDGRKILLEQAQRAGDLCLIDITNDQAEFDKIVHPFLKELDFDGGVTRWWPLGKQRLVVVDPIKNLGQPTVATSGIPTRVLAQSVTANKSAEVVARWYEATTEEVRDACEFENSLAA
ncbi:MAG TPA: hypothetical protein VHE61_15880 [Opitutaceae bacterium]|nr:hypothetical protein [Opitutaceae bacterium]